MNCKIPKWKRFELLAKSIQEQLSPNANVIHNEMVMGQSGTKRQIDISIRAKIGQFEFFSVIDCKDYKKPVDVKDVEEVAGLIEDVKANSGAIVSYNGFTSTAKIRAKQKNIKLYRLIDAESLDWMVEVAIPVLYKIVSLVDCDIIIKSSYMADMPIIYGDNGMIDLYNDKKMFINTVDKLFKINWNNGKLNYSNGKHELNFNKLYVRRQDEYFPVDIVYQYSVNQKAYKDNVKLKKIKGFYCEDTKGIFTRDIETERIDIADIENRCSEMKIDKDIETGIFMGIVIINNFKDV